MCKHVRRQKNTDMLYTRVVKWEIRKILRFRVVAEKVHSAQPKRFARRARNTASLKSIFKIVILQENFQLNSLHINIIQRVFG